MVVNANSLSLLSRSSGSAPVAAGSRASQRQQAEPVDPTEAVRDPNSSEYRELQAMKQRDREVRQHEQAHVSAGGAHVSGGATFSYETGPDGRRYAVGGEVQIDTSAVAGDPEATIRKMQAVRSAANAPAEPSAQDRSVAAGAARAEAQARAELREQQQAADDGEVVPRQQADAGLGGRARSAVEAYRGAAQGDRPASDEYLLDLTA